MIEKYICFRPHFGFCVYNPTEDSLTYTQHVLEASESDVASWTEVMRDHGFGHYSTIPAEVYVHRLRSQLQAVVSREYLVEAMNAITDEVGEAYHFPHHVIHRIKHICKAVKAGEPVPFVKQTAEAV